MLNDCTVVPGGNYLRLLSIKRESQNTSVIEPAMEVAGQMPVITADLVLLSFKRESRNVSIIKPAKEVAVRALEMVSSNVGGECVASSEWVRGQSTHHFWSGRRCSYTQISRLAKQFNWRDVDGTLFIPGGPPRGSK